MKCLLGDVITLLRYTGVFLFHCDLVSPNFNYHMYFDFSHIFWQLLALYFVSLFFLSMIFTFLFNCMTIVLFLSYSGLITLHSFWSILNSHLSVQILKRGTQVDGVLSTADDLDVDTGICIQLLRKSAAVPFCSSEKAASFLSQFS